MVAKIKETNVAPSILLSRYAFVHLFEFIYYHKHQFDCFEEFIKTIYVESREHVQMFKTNFIARFQSKIKIN